MSISIPTIVSVVREEKTRLENLIAMYEKYNRDQSKIDRARYNLKYCDVMLDAIGIFNLKNIEIKDVVTPCDANGRDIEHNEYRPLKCLSDFANGKMKSMHDVRVFLMGGFRK